MPSQHSVLGGEVTCHASLWVESSFQIQQLELGAVAALCVRGGGHIVLNIRNRIVLLNSDGNQTTMRRSRDGSNFPSAPGAVRVASVHTSVALRVLRAL